MKKLIALIAVVFLTASITFAQVHVPGAGSGSHKPNASGSFGCTVLIPLVIAPTGPYANGLGEFVKSATAYTTFTDGNYITFTITGQPKHSFYYTINSKTSDESGGNVIVLDWSDFWNGKTYHNNLTTDNSNGTNTIDDGGSFVITATVTSLTANGATGTAISFPQTLTVSYNSL